MGTSPEAGKPENDAPARQAGSTDSLSENRPQRDPVRQPGSTVAADLTVREQEDELPLPEAEQRVACVGQPIDYDFSADLKLRDEVMDELLELAQGARAGEQPTISVEQPAVSAQRSMEEYDFSLDLRMIEGEEAGSADLITRSVMPTQQEVPAAIEETIEAAADLEWQQVEAEFCHAEHDHSCPHAPREVMGAGSAQNREFASAPSGFHHAERDDNYDDSIAATISQQLAAVAEATGRRKSAFAKFRSKRRSEGAVTGKLAWLASLELWLVLASLSLVFQIFPAAFWSLLAIVDVRNWPWSALVAVEVAVIVVLLLLKVRQTADA